MKLNYIAALKKHAWCLTAVLAVLLTFSSCLEKEIPAASDTQQPFALFKIHLTLVDADTHAPIPGLMVKMPNEEFGPTTDAEGYVQLVLKGLPNPQEFILFVNNKTELSYKTEYIIIRFLNPLFKLTSEGASLYGKRYLGTVEMSVVRELKKNKP